LKIPLRVYYQDTDARFAEQQRVLFMVHTIVVKYHQAARLNELLSVSAEVVKMGRASLVFRQRVERSSELLVEADVTLALVDRSRMKPARLPEELATALRAGHAKAPRAAYEQALRR
jgi:acyl-CoA thioesterase FadM